MSLYDVRRVSGPDRPTLIAAEVSAVGVQTTYTIICAARPGYPPSAWWPYPPRELTPEERGDAVREAVRIARYYATQPVDRGGAA